MRAHKRCNYAGNKPSLRRRPLMMVCFLRSCNIYELAYNFHAYKSSLNIICIWFICILGFPTIVARLVRRLLPRLHIMMLLLVSTSIATLRSPVVEGLFLGTFLILFLYTLYLYFCQFETFLFRHDVDGHLFSIHQLIWRSGDGQLLSQVMPGSLPCPALYVARGCHIDVPPTGERKLSTYQLYTFESRLHRVLCGYCLPTIALLACVLAALRNVRHSVGCLCAGNGKK